VTLLLFGGQDLGPLHRELGKLPRTAPDGLILQVGGHRHRPWLSVDDRCRPIFRARRGHGGAWRTASGLRMCDRLDLNADFRRYVLYTAGTSAIMMTLLR
jgi:hypothetical protein